MEPQPVLLADAHEERAQPGDWDALLQEHFGSEWENAKRVMMCESGGDPTKHNPTPPDDSWGLFQINRYGNLAASRPSAEWLMNGENNIRYAAGMWRAQGWRAPWTNCSIKLGL